MTEATQVTQSTLYDPDGKPLYYRFPAWCALIGVAPSTMLREIELGRAELRIVRIGSRGEGDRYVHRRDADAYAASLSKGAADAPTIGECRDAEIALMCGVRGVSNRATRQLIESSMTVDEARAALYFAGPLTDAGIDRLVGLHYLAKGEIEKITGAAA